MKRILLILLALSLTFSLGAQRITMLHNGDALFGETTLFKTAIASLTRDFPGVKVEQILIDTSDGSTLTMDAQLAAGTPPNVYIDSMVRVSKYIVPEFALPLDGLVRDLDKYNPGMLDQFRRGGKVMALPQPSSAQGMCINLDMMRDIGYTVPKDWTVDDFLKMAKLVKQRYGTEKWATTLFAGNQSGDYLLNNWFASFGVQFYAKGNYDKSVIADTGGAKVYRFYQDLVRAGYVPPHAATLNDDDYAAAWSVGKIAAGAFFPAWTTPYLKTAMDQGLIKEPFKLTFVPFPRAPGVKTVATYVNGAVLVGHRTGTDVDKITARLMEYLNNAWAQERFVRYGGILANRTDVTEKTPDPMLVATAEIMKKGGIQDVGLSDPRFTERRALQYPILQRVLNLTVSPEQAIEEYQAKLSSVK
jgi:ABC-type glycerol-3-phosphate transport system substrate-binding protein